MVEERQVVALHVVQGAAHPGKALAEPEVIGRVRLGRLALRPVPAAAVLEVDHVNRMAADDVAALLEPEVIDAAQGLLEDLRAHDGRADREHDAAVEVPERAGEELEVPLRRPADRRAVEHRMVGDDVVADARMHGHRDAVAERLGEDRRVLPAVLDRRSARRASAGSPSPAAARRGRP